MRKLREINALEQSVAELDQMFLDFALLVEQQGEVLNNIELQVGQAVDHIEDGNKEVHQAIEVQSQFERSICKYSAPCCGRGMHHSCHANWTRPIHAQTNSHHTSTSSGALSLLLSLSSLLSFISTEPLVNQRKRQASSILICTKLGALL